jgi:hypothetical protein
MPEITEELLAILIAKYKGIFETDYPELILSIHFTANGQPPKTTETIGVTGAFFKDGRNYRIGINQNQVVELKCLALFHEFGHARYRRQIDEEIVDNNALILSETAALLKSLELACTEEIPQVVSLAIAGAVELAKTDPIYRAALCNAKNSPIFIAALQKLL